MDSLFRFKQFAVKNASAAMKVGTDAVLLGAWMTVDGAYRMLDIGTGTGVIALLAAQRRKTLAPTEPFLIEALDIEPAAAREAAENFQASPWNTHLQAEHTSWQEWSANPLRYSQYELIFSNPPYFDQALKPEIQERRLARHSDQLPFVDVLTGALALLKPGGRLALILPQQEGLQMLELAERTLYQVKWRMEIVRKTAVYTVRRKPARRLLLEFVKSQQPLPLRTDELTLHDKDGNYSADYRALTGDFYLF